MGVKDGGAFVPDLKGALELSQCRTAVNQALYNWIDVPRGEKAICFERSLLRGLLRLCDVRGLESHGVVHYQALEPLAVPADKISSAVHIMFLVRNTAANAQLVAQQICELKRVAPGQRTFWVAVYPSVGLAFEKVIERAELVADAHLDALPLHFLPYDTDTLTMLRPLALKELMADNNPSILHESSEALLELLRQQGLPRRIRAVGRNAVRVVALLEGALKEASAAKPALQAGAVAALVVFDREADLATPLLSQFTTEGVFDDAFDLATEAGTLSWTDGGKAQHQVLNSKVEVWQEVRLWPFAETLQKARGILEQIGKDAGQQRHGMQSHAAIKLIGRKQAMEAVVNRSVEVMETAAPMALWDVMALERAQLEGASRQSMVASISNLGLARGDSKFVEVSLLEYILQGASLEWCLRILMLRCVCKGPMEDSVLHHAVKLILDKFGFQHILTITNLQAAGLLPTTGHKRSPLLPLNALFSAPDKVASWKLFEAIGEDGVPERTTPYMNYNPVSARLVKHALATYMPRPLTEYMLQCGAAQGGAELKPTDAFCSCVVHQDSLGNVTLERRTSEASRHKQEVDKTAVVIVMMVGGCTFGEMAAIRAEAEKVGTKIVFLTTAIINGNSLIRSFIPDSAELATLDAQRTAMEL